LEKILTNGAVPKLQFLEAFGTSSMDISNYKDTGNLTVKAKMAK
jgi:hypothetical protein